MAFSVGELVQKAAVGWSGVGNFRASVRVEAAKPSALWSNSGEKASPVALRVQSHGLGSSRPSEGEFGAQKSSSNHCAGGRGASVGAGVVRAGPESATPVKPSSNKKRYPGEAKGFVEEMRFVAMKLHTKDQSKEGEKEDKDVQPVSKWEPSIDGYLKFLVNSKKVYDTLEEIVATAAHPSCKRENSNLFSGCGMFSIHVMLAIL